MTATSGRQCIVPSMKSSPLGLWLKTLLESSRWSSRARFLRWQAQPIFSTRLTTFEDDTNCERPLPCNASAQTLKVTDMPSIRCLFRLVPSEPPTDETGCSSSQGEKIVSRVKPDMKNVPRAGDLLPTPRAMEIAEDPDKFVERNGDRQNSMPNLSSMAKFDMLPTPTAIEGVKWTNTWNPNSQMGQSLSAMAGSGMLPTPTMMDGVLASKAGGQIVNGRRVTDKGESFSVKLADLAYRGMLGDVETENTKSDNAGKTSRLSPLFTEEMMGFPLMWTALPFLSESGAPKPSKPTATPSSPK